MFLTPNEVTIWPLTSACLRAEGACAVQPAEGVAHAGHASNELCMHDVVVARREPVSLACRYKDALEALYAQHEERQRERVRAIKAQGGQASTAERVKHVRPPLGHFRSISVAARAACCEACVGCLRGLQGAVGVTRSLRAGGGADAGPERGGSGQGRRRQLRAAGRRQPGRHPVRAHHRRAVRRAAARVLCAGSQQQPGRHHRQGARQADAGACGATAAWSEPWLLAFSFSAHNTEMQCPGLQSTGAWRLQVAVCRACGCLAMMWQACADGIELTPQVDAMLHGGAQEGITFESVHGQDTAVIRAADLDLDRFLPPAEGQAVPTPASELPAEPEVVLLTGANGFLGRFLLLDLLQRVCQRCVCGSYDDVY